VLAVPPRDAFALTPQLADGPAAPARDLGVTPIVNVHVVYDRRVTEHPFAAAVDSPVQWFFDRTDTSELHRTQPGAQYLAVTVSAADDIVDTPSRALQERYVVELGRLLPAARNATVLDAFVTRERRATFRQSAGSAALRPSPVSGLPGVWLAGAWTATGWPDTMESAVRSGIAAAECALAADAPPEIGSPDREVIGSRVTLASRCEGVHG
jgi:hydroxysqualene dehydroxylase